MKNLKLFCMLLVFCCLFSCSRDRETSQNRQSTDTDMKVVLMTHDSFNVSKDVMQIFENRHRCTVDILKSGDAGEALNKAILTKNNPLADLFFGVDNTFLSRAIEQDLFVPHQSPHLGEIDSRLKLDRENRLLPVDYGDVCLNYDVAWFEKQKIAPPTCLEDLLKTDYKGLTVVENPATSSPGLAFLLTTISRFGESGYIRFWQGLKLNDVLITNGWKEAYWGKFTAASEGDRPIVVSYASSPAAEVFFSKEPLDQSPTRAVVDNGAAFRQIEFAGVLKGAKQPDLAGKLLDFMLSVEFQEDIPLQMFVFPSNTKAQLPPVFTKHSRITNDPAQIPHDLISTNRDVWINQWTENML